MMTIFAMFALRGRDRDNPSMRTRSTANFEQRMEIVGGVYLHDHLGGEGQHGGRGVRGPSRARARC